MISGDFYNLDGEKIGSDGQADGKLYIVYDKGKAKEIEKTKGRYTGVVDSKITIANSDVVTAIGDAFARSNNATYDTSSFPALINNQKVGNATINEKAEGGFLESAVSWATADGKTTVTAAPDGAYSDPRVDREATVTSPATADGKAHIHPSGVIERTESTGGSSSGGGVSVYSTGTVKSSRADFVQEPSAKDRQNALSGTNIVVGARSKTVYFYNSGGTYATMKLSNFLKVGRSR
jgi:hypothetical protein